MLTGGGQGWAQTHRHDREGCVDDAGADGGIHRLLHARFLEDACGIIENLGTEKSLVLGRVLRPFPSLAWWVWE